VAGRLGVTGVHAVVAAWRPEDVRARGSAPEGGRRTVGLSGVLDFLLPKKRMRITSATIAQIHPPQLDVPVGLGGAGVVAAAVGAEAIGAMGRDVAEVAGGAGGLDWAAGCEGGAVGDGCAA
jgi:hypothetical protein